MKIITTIIALFAYQMFFANLYAQISNRTPATDIFYTPVRGTSIIEKSISSEVIGTLYIDDNWNMGDVHLIDERVIENFPLKYDIQNNTLEIKVDSKIKICPNRIVSKFYWRNNEDSNLKEFLNCKKYKMSDGSPLIGFFEVIYTEGDGEGYKLFNKTDLLIKEPNYNVALSVGEKDTKILKKNHFYLVNANTAYLVTKNKNNNLAHFQEKELQIKSYMKENKLRFKNKNDLIEVLTYYNSL